MKIQEKEEQDNCECMRGVRVTIEMTKKSNKKPQKRNQDEEK